MKIANIIYEKELINHKKVDYVNYYNEPLTYDEIDKTLPTLYVGWNYMKQCNPNNEIIQNADILKKKIIKNELYFEFSFEESKASHVKGVEEFVNKAPEFYFSSKYKYINLDPIFFQLSGVDDVMDVIPKEIDIYYQYKEDMLYLLKNDKITGINLGTYKYFEFDIDELLFRVAERTQTSIIDGNGNTYQHYYKIFPNFTNLRRYIVAILSK